MELIRSSLCLMDVNLNLGQFSLILSPSFLSFVRHKAIVLAMRR